MAQATKPNTIQSLTVQEAAAEIVRLINAAPRTPWPSEVEAIVAKIGTAADDDSLLQDWRKREAAHHAALAASKYEDMSLGDDFVAYTRSMWEKPVKCWSDVLLRVEIAKHWNVPGGVGDREYPFCIIDEGSEGIMDAFALAQLVIAVSEFGRPPAPAPLCLSPLCLQIREAIGQAICVEQDGSDGAGSEEAFVALMSENDAAIRALEAQLPAIPQMPAELLARAEIAFYFGDRSQDGKTLDTLASDDCFEATSSRLINACMAYFGGKVRP